MVKLGWSGDKPSGDILFNLPIFRDNIKAVSNGRIDEKEDWVIVNSDNH